MRYDWLIVVPIAAVWVVVLVDIVLQPRMPRRVKVAWAVATSLMWPLLIVYWLTRPVQGRLEHARTLGDRRSELVWTVLARESGRFDGAAWARLRTARGEATNDTP